MTAKDEGTKDLDKAPSARSSNGATGIAVVVCLFVGLGIGGWAGYHDGRRTGRWDAWEEIRDVRSWSYREGVDVCLILGYENAMETLSTLHDGGRRFAERHTMPPPYQHRDWDEHR